ncbi:hypothetical protein EIN_419340 [Entamoeba invadens IP1]|uniref:Uncharacterized protein n=1 Tax=Entamoeba invadens IP1 TaxID=370355 RepID=A0A0A1U7Q3_ENTIV|nr:hypothetical protein EIN_419340 [Entamoeba invadens IP1]ELP88005.1 hypothetical protein EIN_419340 [Entamoeba invadens IP1]|eukprot:XP_004254776.1 hypothetical protein EIN_419340 [Entamoeba invadens IP1]
MSNLDPYEYLLTFTPDIDERFTLLKQAMKTHVDTKKMVIQVSPSEDIMKTLENTLEKTKEAKKTCSQFEFAIDQTIAALDDMKELLFETKKQCYTDEVNITTTNNTTIQQLIQLEQKRFEEELQKNSFRKAQLQTIFQKKETSLNAKLMSLRDKANNSMGSSSVALNPKEGESDSNNKEQPSEDETTEIEDMLHVMDNSLKSSTSQENEKSDEKDEEEKSEEDDEPKKKMKRRIRSRKALLRQRKMTPISLYDESILTEEERKQIFKWSGRRVGNIVFDSEVNAMGRNSKMFNDGVRDGKGFVLCIDDKLKNRFGCVITEKVEREATWVADENAFVFVLERNGEKDEKKFDIKKKKASNAFLVGKPTQSGLFAVGNDDIRIMRKYKGKTICFCSQDTFEYNGEKKALCGKVHPEKFELKRLILATLEE